MWETFLNSGAVEQILAVVLPLFALALTWIINKVTNIIKERTGFEVSEGLRQRVHESAMQLMKNQVAKHLQAPGTNEITADDRERMAHEAAVRLADVRKDDIQKLGGAMPEQLVQLAKDKLSELAIDPDQTEVVFAGQGETPEVK